MEIERKILLASDKIMETKDTDELNMLTTNVANIVSQIMLAEKVLEINLKL